MCRHVTVVADVASISKLVQVPDLSLLILFIVVLEFVFSPGCRRKLSTPWIQRILNLQHVLYLALILQSLKDISALFVSLIAILVVAIVYRGEMVKCSVRCFRLALLFELEFCGAPLQKVFGEGILRI